MSAPKALEPSMMQWSETEVTVMRSQLHQLSRAVNTAYVAFSILANSLVIKEQTSTEVSSHPAPYSVTDVMQLDSASVIKSLHPAWENINPIFVYEEFPNEPVSVDRSFTTDATAKNIPDLTTEYLPSKSISDIQPTSYSSGYQLFGYTATIPASSDLLPPKNVLALRGTVTAEEAGASLYDWDKTSPCSLPTSSWYPAREANCGNVKAGFWSFYSGTDLGLRTSLATSIKGAIKKTTDAAPSLPWYAATHSLGGAMLCLGVLDAMEAGILLQSPFVATFGSVVVGNSEWAAYYTSKVPETIRVTNLSDFVPALRSVLPGAVSVKYTHVGTPYLFVWQKDSDWENHSLTDVYMQVVGSEENFSNISVGTPAYPVGIRN